MRRLQCRWHKQGGQTYWRFSLWQEVQKRQVYVFLGAVTLGCCYLFCLRHGVFGAKVDWISQHSVLPDYFRQQFYETGSLFPEFAVNIGGGQNIYHFAYYGLYNPLLLPSYMLPFVKMSDYMMAVQLAGLMASVIMMYEWLKKRGFKEMICGGTAAVFLLSGPMIFHSYNQIMFVNYMPFLIMGLMGVDRHFDSDKAANKEGKCGGHRSGMLTLGIFLMIMTSFYFSIGGMLVLVLYGIHRYLMVYDERGEKITLKGFLTEGIRFSIPFVTAVMMSGVLLVSTAFALAGREGKAAGLNLAELLIPRISMTRFCYAPYGIGMTTLAVTALIAMMFGRKRHERALAWSCMAVLTIPAFAYLLNGGLYIRDKAMIPFLPLLCYVLAYYLECQEKKEVNEGNRFIRLFPYILTIGLIYVNRYIGEDGSGKYWKLLLLDGIVMLISCLISVHPMIPVIVMLMIFNCVCHDRADRMLDREFYEEVTDSDIGDLIADVTEKEEGYYRTEQLGDDEENAANLNRVWNRDQYLSSVYSSSYHEGYQKFRKETFQLEEPFRNFLMQSAVHNPVYQRFMGVKYIVSEEDIPGYETVESRGRWKAYRNDSVSPAAYGTDRVIEEETYRRLEYPYNQLALLEYAVVKDTAVKDAVTDETAEADADAEEISKRLEIFASPVELNLPEEVRSDVNETVHLNLPESEKEGTEDEVLFLQFQIKNLKPSKDAAVWVEGIRNKLTAENHFYYNENTEFSYTVPLKNGQKSVEITFGKGEYEIADVKAFTGMLPDDGAKSDSEVEEKLYQSEFRTDKEKTKGNCIAGTIDVKRQGYFITTIPYDENFEILVDGEKVKGEEVNTAFLGFPIDAGKHEVRVMYHAPGIRMGKMISVIGFLMFLLVSYLFPFSRLQGFVQDNIVNGNAF